MKNDDDEEEEEDEGKDEKNNGKLKKEEGEESMDSAEVKNDVPSTMMNGTASPQPQSSLLSTTSADSPSPAQIIVGVKRPSEDEDNKPDLKKFRVASSLNKHGFKVNGIVFFLSY